MSSKDKPISFSTALLSGGVAGTTVDIALYPLDTIKTRLQSSQGFLKAGGFRGVYKGLSVAAIGSAPGAALFFSTYETCKYHISEVKQMPAPLVQMLSASLGEMAACMVRVPTEVVKQRMQAGVNTSMIQTATTIFKNENGFFGFYKGFGITILREIPFAFIQFPIYEYLKVLYAKTRQRSIYSYEAALCGSIAGGVAAAVTTPLDVIKTRLMLGKDREGIPYKNAIDTLRRILQENSSGNRWKVLFRGIEPRVMWISIGGFVFFGAYEQSVKLLQLF